jgi:hypothetical protein
MKDTKETGGQEAPDQAKIDQLKAKYPEGIYSVDLTFNDEEGLLHSVPFIYRKPSTMDMEAFVRSASKNPITANLNLIQSLIVHPEPLHVINCLREYPMAVTRFVDEAISPFFGENTAVNPRKL